MGAQSTGFTESLILLVFLLMVLISIQLFRTQKGIGISNRVLGTLFALLSIQILISYFTFLGILVKPLFLVIDDTLLLGVGPLLYLYAKTAIGNYGKLAPTDVLHFIPVLALLIPFLFFLVTTNDYSEWLLGFDLSESIKTFSVKRFQLIAFWTLTHINLYLIASFVLAMKSEQRLFKSANYKWVMYTLISFQVINIASFVQVLGVYFFPVGYQNVTFLLILVTLLTFLISILWKGMNGSPLFSEHKKSRYENSKLGEDEKTAIQQQLEKVIDQDKLYLKPDVTVKSLAELLGKHPKKVSQVINEIFGMSFYDWLNHHRVNYAIELLGESGEDKLTISEIQYKSGFNSKSSFHTQFKKKTGVSPKEFRTKKSP